MVGISIWDGSLVWSILMSKYEASPFHESRSPITDNDSLYFFICSFTKNKRLAECTKLSNSYINYLVKRIMGTHSMPFEVVWKMEIKGSRYPKTFYWSKVDAWSSLRLRQYSKGIPTLFKYEVYGTCIYMFLAQYEQEKLDQIHNH